VSNVGPQIRQAEAVKAANPGRTARATRNARLGRGGLLSALTVGAQIGEAMRQNLPSKATPSNRGTGRATDNVKPGPSKKTKTPTKNAGNYNTRDADGTVRSRKKVGPAKVGSKKVGTIAQAFDKSYAAAKKAGKKTFMFRGKKYTTD
tara:strand:- start:409 stop:852 length:444 start_codon:yes stop_codon:yes gene_type:complete